MISLFPADCKSELAKSGPPTEAPPIFAVPECRTYISKVCPGKQGEDLLICAIDIGTETLPPKCLEKMNMMVKKIMKKKDRVLEQYNLRRSDPPCYLEIRKFCSDVFTPQSTTMDIFRCLDKNRKMLSLQCKQHVIEFYKKHRK